VTYGKGVFWKEVDLDQYRVLASDIAQSEPEEARYHAYRSGIDCRALPYEDDSLDAVVLDPPYMEGLFRKAARAGQGTHSSFQSAYARGGAASGPKYHEAVIDLYLRAGLEAWRVVTPGGKVVVKCQDEVSANRQRLTHVEIITGYEDMGFYSKDLFVLVRSNAPAVSRLVRQVHARKRHSYFLVFEKPKGRWKVPRSARVAPAKGPFDGLPVDAELASDGLHAQTGRAESSSSGRDALVEGDRTAQRDGDLDRRGSTA